MCENFNSENYTLHLQVKRLSA